MANGRLTEKPDTFTGLTGYLFLKGVQTMTILFHELLCCREFGSSVLHVPTLLGWVASKGLYLRTDPPLADFEFAQVEAMLCAIERRVFTLSTPEGAVARIAANPVLAQDPSADDFPHWLVGAEAHRKWRGVLSGAIATGELVLLDFDSLLPIAAATKAEAVPVTNSSGNEATNAPAADVKPNADDMLSALFDPVTVETLEKMFAADGKWRGWAEKAKANGLINAREKRAKFNPYKAGAWFVSGHSNGWDNARLYRTLKTNLPARSHDKAHLLTGVLD